VVSLIVQGAGSGIAAVSEINGNDTTPGGNIVVAGEEPNCFLQFSISISDITFSILCVFPGLAIQLFAYIGANILAIIFFIRTAKNPPQHPLWTHQTRLGLLCAFISAIFVLLRSTFRTIELAVGWVGVISTTEVSSIFPKTNHQCPGFTI